MLRPDIFILVGNEDWNDDSDYSAYVKLYDGVIIMMADAKTAITIKQTVAIDNSTVTITGTGSLALRCGLGAGFACQGSGEVIATTIVA